MNLLIKSIVCLSIGLFSLISTCAEAVDLKAGEEKSSQCISCHGDKGVSTNGQFPRLAGQQAGYLQAQLKGFKEGARVNPIMQKVASGLTDGDIENLAAFFSKIPAKPATLNAKPNVVGKEKYAMCAGCHGATGEGRGAIPRLAGQHEQYLIAQLKAFKSNTRRGGPMPSISNTLSDTEIQMLSNYLSALK